MSLSPLACPVYAGVSIIDHFMSTGGWDQSRLEDQNNLARSQWVKSSGCHETRPGMCARSRSAARGAGFGHRMGHVAGGWQSQSREHLLWWTKGLKVVLVFSSVAACALERRGPTPSPRGCRINTGVTYSHAQASAQNFVRPAYTRAGLSLSSTAQRVCPSTAKGDQDAEAGRGGHERCACMVDPRFWRSRC